MANPVIDTIYRNGTTYDIKDKGAQRTENKATSIRPANGASDDKYPTEKAVATALVAVDTALGTKEDKANKVSAWQLTPDDDHYPTEKLVKGALDTKELASSRVSAFQQTPDHSHYPSEKQGPYSQNHIV